MLPFTFGLLPGDTGLPARLVEVVADAADGGGTDEEGHARPGHLAAVWSTFLVFFSCVLRRVLGFEEGSFS